MRRGRSSELELSRLMSPGSSQSHVCRASSTPGRAAAAWEGSEPEMRARRRSCVSHQNLQQLNHEHVNSLLFKTTNKLDSWNLHQHSLVCVCVCMCVRMCVGGAQTGLVSWQPAAPSCVCRETGRPTQTGFFVTSVGKDNFSVLWRN